MRAIEALARRQLEAYNAADLDAFCACYHEDVVVLEGDRPAFRGMAAFRERYRPKFEAGGFGGSVDARIVVGPHCVDDERYWTEGPQGRVEGRVAVRYTLRDGRIGVVQFLR